MFAIVEPHGEKHTDYLINSVYFFKASVIFDVTIRKHEIGSPIFLSGLKVQFVEESYLSDLHHMHIP